jgi:hypothetical protein
MKLLFVRQLSYGEIEEELHIDRPTLQSRIEMLVHMGYLERTTMSMGGCGGGCMGCAKGTITECGGAETEEDQNGGGEDGGIGGKGGESDAGDSRDLSGYELTPKGQRMLEK